MQTDPSTPDTTSTPSPRRRGRRPGSPDTRAQIVDAAKGLFADRGFGAVSLRAIARRAEVDPALVHHYFGSKTELFLVALIDVRADPAVVLEALTEVPSGVRGRALVLAFTNLWESTDLAGRFQEVVLGQLADSGGTSNAAEFITDIIIDRLTALCAPDQRNLRANLVASQIMGMGLARYVIHVEPLASMDRWEVAATVGPTIQHYLTGTVDPNSSPGPTPRARHA